MRITHTFIPKCQTFNAQQLWWNVMVIPCFSKISFHTEKKNNKAFVKNDDELIESETKLAMTHKHAKSYKS